MILIKTIILMKKIFFALLSVILFLFSAGATAQTKGYPFQSGENMELIIHYKWGFSADIASVKFTFTEKSEEGKEPYYHLLAHASTYKFWDSFFKVRDIYESKFYVKDLSPLYFHRDVSEGNFYAKNWYSWQDGGKTLNAIVDKKGRPRRDTTYYENDVIRDIINIFFTVRCLDFAKLEKGKPAPFIIALDKDILDMRVRFVGREKKRVPKVGTFNAIKLAIAVNPRKGRTKDGETSVFSFGEGDGESVFYGEEKVFIWLSDDANKLPIFFSAPVAVGAINGRIGTYEGVKYPLTSLIKVE